MVGISTLGVAGLGAAGCAPAEPGGQQTPGAKKGGEFHGAWPYLEPPEGTWNYSGPPNGINNGGIYDLLYLLPSGHYHWDEKTWDLYLLDSYELDEASATFTLKIKEGLKWSDDSPVTSQDFMNTWYCRWVFASPLWNYVNKIEAPDDLTFKATMNAPSTAAERYLLREKILPSSQYGEFGERAGKLQAAGKEASEDAALLDDMNTFTPEEVVCSGPYIPDFKTVTSTEMTLVKNPKGAFADQVKFDKIVIYNGETNEVTPLVQSKDVDYATHGFPVATEQAFEGAGIRIIRPPTYSGGALAFNQGKVKAFKDVRVRQAFAMAIDRAQNGEVTLGPSGVPVKYMSGLADATSDEWIAPDILSGLNTYEFDQDAAANLLEEAGWSRKGQKWQDADGKPAEFELLFQQDFADYSASATDIKDQLNAFGLEIVLRGKESSQVGPDQDDGKFELTMEGWGSSSHPHPSFSYIGAFITPNYPITTPQGGRGIDFDLNPTTKVLGKVDIQKLVTESGEGLDEAAQKEKITQLAQIFNEQLPIIPLFERFGNNPALEGQRVTGFPADDDPIIKNSPYGDNFVIMGILDGTIGPA
jgi:peptide/nickel transport system substrate-binding protein